MPDAPQGIVAWPSLIGKQVVLTLTNGTAYVGILESLENGQATVRGWSNGIADVGPAFLQVPDIESIVPAPALAEQTGHPLPTDTIRQDTTTQDGA
jgi:hypothetical protein